MYIYIYAISYRARPFKTNRWRHHFVLSRWKVLDIWLSLQGHADPRTDRQGVPLKQGDPRKGTRRRIQKKKKTSTVARARGPAHRPGGTGSRQRAKAHGPAQLPVPSPSDASGGSAWSRSASGAGAGAPRTASGLECGVGVLREGLGGGEGVPWTPGVRVATKKPPKNANTLRKGACKTDPKCPSCKGLGVVARMNQLR